MMMMCRHHDLASLLLLLLLSFAPTNRKVGGYPKSSAICVRNWPMARPPSPCPASSVVWKAGGHHHQQQQVPECRRGCCGIDDRSRDRTTVTRAHARTYTKCCGILSLLLTSPFDPMCVSATGPTDSQEGPCRPPTGRARRGRRPAMSSCRNCSKRGPTPWRRRTARSWCRRSPSPWRRPSRGSWGSPSPSPSWRRPSPSCFSSSSSAPCACMITTVIGWVIA